MMNQRQPTRTEAQNHPTQQGRQSDKRAGGGAMPARRAVGLMNSKF